ncbi:MAG: hypothetical protein P1P88_08610 [Bacteroidales bacterium]|nr:hypothetical protein [Bacteroidales bacterium]
MFDPTRLIINAFIDRLKEAYTDIYGNMEPGYPDMITFIGKMALENIANCDAAYHDLHHTIMVTDVGKEILKGKHILEGGITPFDWLHFIVGALCHDIGYVRGICPGDENGKYITNNYGDKIELAKGSTDASLTPYHVNRSKIFVHSRFKSVKQIDDNVLCQLIERTRFPVPESKGYEITDDLPGLLRASDLIGQMADLTYSKKSSSLFIEFEELGIAKELGYKSGADLRLKYPDFFWNNVSPLVKGAIKYLRVTQTGKKWLANLYSNIFTEEHATNWFGAERGIAHGSAGAFDLPIEVSDAGF